MSAHVEKNAGWHLDAAERRGRCLAPKDVGLTRALRYRRPWVIEPIAGLFARRKTWRELNPAERTMWLMRALGETHPTWRFCGASAAVAYGLPVTWGLLTHVFVFAPSGARKKGVSGVWRRSISDDDVTVVNGLRLTPLWRTVFDCLATMPPADALAVADRAARLSGSSARQVCEYVRTAHRGRRGVRQALRTAALVDGRAESGGESIARHTMHELGFVEPELQVWIKDPVEPKKWFRVDFLWVLPDGSIVIGELDGRQKSERPELMGGRSAVRVMQDERLRESHLTALRPAIVRFDYDTARDPERLGALLERYGVPKRTREPSLPRATRTIRAELVLSDGQWTLVTEEVLA